MTEKELKKLNRYQLLELLVMQTERADELQKKVDELQERLAERELGFSKLGSIAEAAVQVAGVFEAAEQAAELYLESAQKQAADIVARARHQAAGIIVQAQADVLYITSVQEDIQDDIQDDIQEDSNIAAGKRHADDKEI